MLLVAALVGGLVPRARRAVVRAAVLAAGAGIVAFSAANPDATVAARNVERWRETGRIDTGYLASLSADAVPALAALPEPLRSRALEPIAARLGPSEPWPSWEPLSRTRARGAPCA